MTHTHDISKNVCTITIKQTKKIGSIPTLPKGGFEIAIDSNGREYYFFVRDGFAPTQGPIDVICYEFIIPEGFADFTKIDRVQFISPLISGKKLIMLTKGRLCTWRMAAFKNDHDLIYLKYNNFYYIPTEGIYDGECEETGGLRPGDVHGFFIKLTQEEFDIFESKYYVGSQLGTNICPGNANSTGIFIYKPEHIR